MFFDKIAPFICIYLLILLIIAQHRGLIYDIAKEKEDPYYKGHHFFSYKNGKIRFALPILILSKSYNQDTIKYALSYNKIIINIWTTIAVLSGVYLFWG